MYYFQIEECEKAYLKMENVLIDDRRIHVDFCQSIATHKWNKSSNIHFSILNNSIYFDAEMAFSINLILLNIGP